MERLNFNLSQAASKGKINQIKALIKRGANVNNNGRYVLPLSGAALNGQINTVKYLVEKCGANCNDIAIRNAIETGNAEIVKYLISKKGANFSDFDLKSNYLKKRLKN